MSMLGNNVLAKGQVIHFKNKMLSCCISMYFNLKKRQAECGCIVLNKVSCCELFMRCGEKQLITVKQQNAVTISNLDSKIVKTEGFPMIMLAAKVLPHLKENTEVTIVKQINIRRVTVL